MWGLQRMGSFLKRVLAIEKVVGLGVRTGLLCWEGLVLMWRE